MKEMRKKKATIELQQQQQSKNENGCDLNIHLTHCAVVNTFTCGVGIGLMC